MRFGKVCLILALALALRAEDQPVYTFGTTVVDVGGLHGLVYSLKPKIRKLPDFARMKPVGSIYTTSLNVWPQRFDEGFPGLTNQFEWFGIEYSGRFWIGNAGVYRFSLLADDGARLYLNDKLIINNDGEHQAMGISGGVTLTRGVYEIRIDYYQGPRYTVALVLAIAPPGEPWRIFDMRDFKPPNDPDGWEKGAISHIQAPTI
jgi:hypothetical protein